MWSVLALVAATVGTASTLVLARMWVVRWAHSGQKFMIGEPGRIELRDSDLDSLVYYESRVSVGSRFMRLEMRNQYGERFFSRVPTDDNQFEVGGLQGRALFQLNLDEPGAYQFQCDNPNYASDGEIPPDDRIVFLREPNTRDEMLAIRRLILVTGGSLTIVATLLLYLLHGLEMAKSQKVKKSK